MRVLEGRAPGGNNGAHAIPDYPNFSITFEEQLVVDQSTVDDARDHIPITDDHTDIGVLLAPLGKLLHHLFGRQRMEMLHEPGPCLSQARFPAHIVQSKHQVYFVIAQLRHVLFLFPDPCGSYACVFSSGSWKAGLRSRSWALDAGMFCRWNSIWMRRRNSRATSS